jgi:hypothetical protein
VKHVGEIGDADEDRALTERVLSGETIVHGLSGRPVEEDQRDEKLREDEGNGEKPTVEEGAAVHR